MDVEVLANGEKRKLSALISELQSHSITCLVLEHNVRSPYYPHLPGIFNAISTNSSLTYLFLGGEPHNPYRFRGRPLKFGEKAHPRFFDHNWDVAPPMLSGDAIAALCNMLRCNSSLECLKFVYWDPGECVNDFLLALKDNKTLKELHGCVLSNAAASLVEDVFSENTTLGVYKKEKISFNLLVKWFVTCNHVCNKLSANKRCRDSIPREMKSEAEIESFVQQLLTSSSEWRAMKLVVLGHGQIGKSTLLSKVRSILGHSASEDQKDIPSTIGIDCNLISLAQGEISVWDFGGQLEYICTHQFFLSIEMVAYLVCFDLSQPPADQFAHLRMWLRFLNSALPLRNDYKYSTQAKWVVILVGLKQDAQDLQSPLHVLEHEDVTSWATQYPRLPIFPKLFLVSSKKSIDSVNQLLNTVQQECDRIFNQHATLIPTSYRSLLHNLQGTESPIHLTELFTKYHGMDIKQFTVALQYLHCIGRLVFLQKSSLVYVDPQVAPKVASQFVSPDHVRRKLLGEKNVQILAEDQVGYLLNIDKSSNSLQNEMSLIIEMGICFKLNSANSTSPLYLFPNLSNPSTALRFSLPLNNSTYWHSGIRITVPRKDMIFVPGFYCQLAVKILSRLNIYQEDIITVCQNGMLIQCAGLFHGQLIVMIDLTNQHLVFAMMASRPDYEYITSVFNELLQMSYPQYIGSEEKQLCPECIKKSTFCMENGTAMTEIGFFRPEATVCTMLHQINQPSSGLEDAETCRSHNIAEHDFFVSYRVASEGKQHSTKEPKFGISQLIYEKIAVSKTRLGVPVFAFWDKKCLNDGMSWEKGFLRGLLNSKVIVLLISNEGLAGIQTNAQFQQDNVLVEYECALLKHHLHAVRVVPVFISNVNFSMQFPNTPHKRGKLAQRTLDKLLSTKGVLPETRQLFSSISETMKAIFGLQGIRLDQRGEDSKEIEDLITRLLDVLYDRPQLVPVPTISSPPIIPQLPLPASISPNIPSSSPTSPLTSSPPPATSSPLPTSTIPSTLTSQLPSSSVPGEAGNRSISPKGENVSSLHASREFADISGKYEGQWQDGKIHGKGTMHYTTGDVYTGTWANGKRLDGLGEMSYSNGDCYNGHWVGGKREGQGVCKFASGVKYEGEWVDDKCHGIGSATCPNGDMFKGTWERNAIKDGQGKITQRDGLVYEGNFTRGKRSGRGIATYKHTNIQDPKIAKIRIVQYEGEWMEDQYCGKGKCVYADGGRYSGQWKHGVRHGTGAYMAANGDSYLGEWKDDLFHGLGKYAYRGNLGEYYGAFSNNVQHGCGVFIWPHGHIVLREFDSGSFRSELTIDEKAKNSYFEKVGMQKILAICNYQN